jgi:hypothetical protein
MEAVGAVASVAGILQVAAQIILSCNIYLGKANSAGDDIRKILIEIGGIKLVVDKLQDHHHDNDSVSKKDLLELESTLKACLDDLEDLSKILRSDKEPEQPELRKRYSRGPSIFKRLAWPFNEGRAKAILERLSRHKEILTLYWTINSR